jgi:hypothetical protein
MLNVFSDYISTTFLFTNAEVINFCFGFEFRILIKSRRMRWAGHVVRMGEGRGAYRILVGRSEGRRSI